MNKYKVLYNYANLFRIAIETIDEAKISESVCLLQYPYGCCGEVSDLLGQFLYENGFSTEKVSGNQGIQSHMWLEYNKIIIDITADQFKDINKKVIVTLDRTWHDKFQGQRKVLFQKLDYHEEGYEGQVLFKLYSNLKKHINSNLNYFYNNK